MFLNNMFFKIGFLIGLLIIIIYNWLNQQEINGKLTCIASFLANFLYFQTS
jgi:hypothetical protein